MHFTYFAYETHANVKLATIRALDAILQERTSRMFPTTTQRAVGYRAYSVEIAFCPCDRKWFGSPKECLCVRGFATITELRRNSELTDDINGALCVNIETARLWSDSGRDRMTW